MKMERSDGGRWRTQQAGWPILNRIDDLLNVDPAHTTFQPPHPPSNFPHTLPSVRRKVEA